MSEMVDARGLSCPQPVMETLDAIKRLGSGELEVLVDTQTSAENVSRAATSQGWQVRESNADGDTFRLVLAKG